MNNPAIDLQPSGEAPRVVLPAAASIFLARAERFEALALHHGLGEWLAFLGRVSRAQHEALQALADVETPTAEVLERARTHRMPPVAVTAGECPAVWREVLRRIAGDLLAAAPAGARDALGALRAASDGELDELGAKLLDGEPGRADLDRLPYVAAALQVVFTAIASRLDADALPLLDAHGVCRVCGSLPVTSVIRSQAPVANLRYAHCSLCNTEWNVPRAVCVNCGDDEKVTLHEIDGDDGIARAESCGACHSYLKLIVQGRNARIDPIADDLASVALDLLVDEAGFERSGPNLLLIGAGE